MLLKRSIFIVLCGIFYSVLCIFSIVTGIIYMSGKKQLNPLELSDKFVSKIKDLNAFARKMGLVTFVVGIVQGITAYAIIFGKGLISYGIAVGFTLFSICSVAFKLKGKVNAFPIMKAIFYVTILVILLLKSTRVYFF